MSYLVLDSNGNLLEVKETLSLHKAVSELTEEFPSWSFVYDGNVSAYEERDLESRTFHPNPTRSLPMVSTTSSRRRPDQEMLLAMLTETSGLTKINHEEVLRMSEEDAIRRLRPWLPNGKNYATFSSAKRSILNENYKTGKASKGISCWNPWRQRMDTIRPALSRGLSLMPAYHLIGGPLIPNGAQERMLLAQKLGHPLLQAKGSAPAWRPLDISRTNFPKFTLCPRATPDCISTCLVFSGRNDLGYQAPSVFKNGQLVAYPISSGQIVKARRTQALLAEPVAFCKLLLEAVKWHRDNCKQNGIRAFVRLNILSDIPWELFYPELLSGWGHDVVFYDYTKIPARKPMSGQQASDYPYHLTFSYGGGKAALQDMELELAHGTPCAIVFYLGPENKFKRSSDKASKGKKIPWSETEWRGMKFNGYPVYDGDCHDLRPLDPSEAMIVGLQYKPPVAKKQQIKNHEKMAFLVYAETTEVTVHGVREQVWTVPASARQLGSDLYREDPNNFVLVVKTCSLSRAKPASPPPYPRSMPGESQRKLRPQRRCTSNLFGCFNRVMVQETSWILPR